MRLLQISLQAGLLILATALLPLPLALSRLAERPAADLLLTCVCVILGFLYLCAFVLRWQVW